MKYILYGLLIILLIVGAGCITLFLYVYGPLQTPDEVPYDLDKVRHYVTYCYQDETEKAKSVILDADYELDPTLKVLETLTMREYDFLFLSNNEKNTFSKQGGDATLKSVAVSKELIEFAIEKEEAGDKKTAEKIWRDIQLMGETLQTNHFLKVYNMLGDALVKYTAK